MILVWLLMSVVLVSGINQEEIQDHCLLDSSDNESPSGQSCKTEDRAASGVSLIQQLHGKYPEKRTVPRSSNVYISVKSTSAYHKSRLSLLLLTWLQTVEPEQVHIITDGVDEWSKEADRLGFHVVQSNCERSHNREALCCKSGFEYNAFYAEKESGKGYSWYCHFDDDMYVNVGALVATLAKYNPGRDRLYLGRWSVNRDTKFDVSSDVLKYFPNHKASSYHFGTGAAYCISSSLMKELEPYLRGPKFLETCANLGLPDDMTVGAVIGAVLGYDLTDVHNINTHLNGLMNLDPHSLKDQISISYGQFTIIGQPVIKNIVNIPGARFSVDEDPTRFLSYHCLLYSKTSWC
eukprot:Em0022g870a